MEKTEEYFPVVFKAVVDQSGRITIPFEERKIAGIEPATIVQVKLKPIGMLTEKEKLKATLESL